MDPYSMHVHENNNSFPSVINLNVGGKIFATRLSTLLKYSDSMLAVMFSGRHIVDKDCDGNYFIDRDGTYFQYILNFLRNAQDLPPIAYAEAVLQEATYYGITPLIQHLKNSPPLFSEYIVRQSIRDKLQNYNAVKDKIIELARKEVVDNGAVVSVVRIATTKNQPIPRDLQFSKQVYKQYYRKFRTYKSFDSCFGKYHIHIPCEEVKGHPSMVMDLLARCLCYDLNKEGYRGTQSAESIYDEEHKMKTITWSDEEFHVCTSCHMFRFDWLDSSIQQ